VDTLLKMLRELETQGFFGSVEVKFEHGHVTVIRKTQTYRRDGACHRNNRKENTWTP
jgi:hypothetical protein